MAIFCIGLSHLKLSHARKRIFHMVHVMGKSVCGFQSGDKAVVSGPDHFFGRKWFWPDHVFGPIFFDRIIFFFSVKIFLLDF